jgi:hypothetical protein
MERTMKIILTLATEYMMLEKHTEKKHINKGQLIPHDVRPVITVT